MTIRLDKALAPDEKRTLIAHVCDRKLLFKTALVDAARNYLWDSTGLDWSDYAQRAVYVSRDTVAPTFSRISVAGRSVVLTFSEALSAASGLANSAFTVMKTAQGVEETLTPSAAPAISGAAVTLTLSEEAVMSIDTVTVSYEKPDSGSNNKLADRTDNEVEDFTTEADAPPHVVSIARQTPSASPTNADSLTWRVTFSKDVANVDATDFAVGGTTATPTVVAVMGSSRAYDVMASGGNLADLNDTVTLAFAEAQNIADTVGSALAGTVPTGTNESTWVVDNTAPTVASIVRQDPTASPTLADELTWRVTFSEEVANVDVADFTVTGTTATLTATAVAGSSLAYDVMASGGNLSDLNGTVTLAFAEAQDIVDAVGHALATTEPTGTNDNTWMVDTTALAHCNASDAKEIWCANLTVGQYALEGIDRFGFNKQYGAGAIAPNTFTWRTVTLEPIFLVITSADLLFLITRHSGTRPSDGILGAANFSLEIGTGAGRKTFAINNPALRQDSFNFIFSNQGLSWSVNDSVRVKLRVVNSPATGTPSISGTADVGETLTAGQGTIADVDGIPNDVAFSYQWIRVDGAANELDIPGATSKTYALVDADGGKKVKVRMSFTDSLATGESRTSDAYPSGTIASGKPSISGTARVGETLTAGEGTITDADGIPNDVAFSYQWIRVDGAANELDIPGATSKTYTLVDADGGQKVKVRISFTDSLATGESRTSDAYPSGTIATGKPSISGTARVGETLAAGEGTITDVDGIPNDVAFSYQWIRVDGAANELDIPGATSKTYTLVDADGGQKVKVRISFTDSLGTGESRTSDAYPEARTVLGTALAHCNASDPREIWCADLTVGQYAVAGIDRFGFYNTHGAGAVAPNTFTWRTVTLEPIHLAIGGADLLFGIQRHSGTTPSDGMLGAAKFSLEIGTGAGSKTFAINNPGQISAFTFSNQGLSWSANDLVPVKLRVVNSPATGRPSISGTARVGETLTAGQGTIADVDGIPNDAAFSYQWIRVDGAANELDIPGATSKTYTLVDADGGKKVKVRMSFTDSAGTGESRTSDAYPEARTVLGTAFAHCSLSDPREIWCANLTVGQYAVAGIDRFGFDDAQGAGAVAPNTFTWRTVTLEPILLAIGGADLLFGIQRHSGTTPSDGMLGADKFSLEIGTGAGSKTFAINNPGVVASFTFSNQGLSWSVNDSVPVKLRVNTNDSPTSANAEVTTQEGGTYTFGVAVFTYADTENDAMVAVKIVTLPDSRELRFDDVAIPQTDLTKTVTTQDLRDGKLKYVPPEQAYGDDYTTFTFKVNDGQSDSASTYTMTVDVTGVGDPATGAPIVAAPNVFRVPAVLSVDFSGIEDHDGVTTIADSATYEWKRFAANGTTFEANLGTGSTYKLTGSDAGKKIKVEVSFTDDGGSNEGPLTSAAYPSSGAVTAAAACDAPTLTGGATFIGSDRKLAVGKVTESGSDIFGFASSHIGDLDAKTFAVGGTNYQISIVTVSDSGQLIASLDKNLSADHERVLVLNVCDQPFAFSEASGPDVDHKYTWSSTGQNWSPHAQRTLRLSQDTTAPTFESASVAHDTLVLVFSEPLGAAASLSNTAFTVKKTPANGTEEDVVLSGAPTVEGTKVTLTLAQPLAGTDQDVKVSYETPDPISANALVDRFENAVGDFDDAEATNTTDSAPRVASITRHSPADSPTNANSLVWRVTFSEAVTNADAADFEVSGTTATLTVADVTGAHAVDVTATGGDLADLEATVTLSFAAGQDITDSEGNALAETAPTGAQETEYVLDNTAPAVESITRDTPGASPTNADTLVWRVTFSEALGNADATDFEVTGTTATLTLADVTGAHAVDVTATGGDLADLNATVTLSFASAQDIADAAGNALAETAPTGAQETEYVVDNTAPSPVDPIAARVGGTSLVVTFDEALDAASVPANTRFTVMKTPSGSSQAASVALSGTPAIDGAALTLTLAAAVAADDTVTVGYDMSGSGDRLRDPAGNEVADFDEDAANDTESPPRVVSIVRHSPAASPTNADSLVWRVTFSEAVTNADAADFEVSGTTATHTVADVAGADAVDVTVSGGDLDSLDATVALSFASGQDIVDAADNALTNVVPTGANEDSYTIDNSAPSLPTTGGAAIIGTALVLTFGEALDAASVPETDTFKVTVDGGAETEPSAVAIDGAVVTLTLATAVTAGQAVTVRYEAPTGQGAVGLRDAAGNAVASDTGARTVANETGATVPGTPTSLVANVGDGGVANVGDGGVTLAWEAPASDGGTAVTGYEYRYRKESETTWPAWTAVAADARQAAVSGLDNDTLYRFELRAVNQQGAGEAADTTATPDATTCNAPGLAGRDEVWRGTLTVGRQGGGSSNELVGYGWYHTTGALSGRSDSIEIGANRYRIGEMVLLYAHSGDLVGLMSPAPGALVFHLVGESDREAELTDAEKAALVLHVCAREFAFASATRVGGGTAVPGPGQDRHYVWNGAALQWSHGLMRTLVLSKPTSGGARSAVSVESVTEPTGPGEDAVYAKDDRIEVRVRFSAPVVVDASDGAPTLGLALGGVRREAAWLPATGAAAQLIFALTVAEADAGAEAAKAIANGIRLNGGAIRDTAGTDAVFDYGEAPGVVSVEVAPAPGDDGTWSEGEAVEVTLAFAEPVDVGTAEGTPSLGLQLPGAGARRANHSGGSGTERLVFAYTPVAADGSVTAVLVDADSLALNGGTIVSTGGLDAVLAHNGAGSTVGPRSPDPALSVADTEGAEGATLAFQVTLSQPAPTAVTVAYTTRDGAGEDAAVAGEDYTAASGTLSFKPGETQKSVAVTVTDDGLSEGAETLTLHLSGAQGAGIADGDATGTIGASASAAALTAAFVAAPPEHDGQSAFTVELHFSEVPAQMSYRTVRDTLFNVSGGDVKKARRLNPPSNQGFEITVEPAGNAAATLELATDLPACGVSGSVCTADGRTLEGPFSVTVPGPAALSVADAEVDEEPGATLAFVVSLDRTRHAPVTVDYTTADGTAVAGEDYTATSGALAFAAGETEKTVSVPVLDDSHDEGSETLTLSLSDAEGAAIDDGMATGTIRNSDPLPQAWLARFGRTATDHTIDAIGWRVQATGEADEPVPHLTFGGRRLDALITALGGDSPEGHSEGRARADPLADESAWARMDRLREELSAVPGFGGEGAFRSSPDSQSDGSPLGHLPSAGRPFAGLGGGVFVQGAQPPGMPARAGLSQDGPLQGEPLQGEPPHGTAPIQSEGHGESGWESALDAIAAAAGDARWARLYREGRSLTGVGGRLPLRDALMGSSFFYAPAPNSDGEVAGPLGRWAVWGTTAATRFSGAEEELSISGDVATATLGFDTQRGRWMAGLALSYSDGRGGYTHPESPVGAIHSTLTQLAPYARFTVNERTSVWGTLGYGTGRMTLSPEGAAPAGGTEASGAAPPALVAGLASTMAGLGGRAELSRSLAGGDLALAVVSDARFSRTVSDATEGMMGAAGAASRVRLMLEGRGSLALGQRVSLTPTLQAGLRYDGGDAETGAGIEVVAGLGMSAGSMSVQLDARGLLAHQDAAYEEWGLGASLTYRPRPDGTGLSVAMGSAWGATGNGIEAMWAQPHAGGLANGAAAIGGAHRVQAELAYGFKGPKGRALWAPFVAADAAAGSVPVLRFGARMTAEPHARAELEITREASVPGSGGPRADCAIRVVGSILW